MFHTITEQNTHLVSSTSYNTSCRMPYKHLTGNETDAKLPDYLLSTKHTHTTRQKLRDNFPAKVINVQKKNQSKLDVLSTQHEHTTKFTDKFGLSAVVYESR